MGKYRYCYLILILLVFSTLNSYSQLRHIYTDPDSENKVIKFDFYSAKEGYVAFDKWIGYTQDSGRTFVRKHINYSNTNFNNQFVNLTFGFIINGVHAFSKDTLLVYGNYGAEPSILYSIDGGNSFSLVYHLPFNPNYLYKGVFDIVFPSNSTVGYSVIEDRILKTSNKGLTWSVVYMTSKPSLSQMQFFNTNKGYALGTNYILKTNDGGITWTSLPLPKVKALSFHFLNEKLGWVNTTDYYDGFLYNTADSGKTWTLMNNPEFYDVRSNSLYFSNDSTGYVIGGEFDILKTTDKGQTWEALTRNDSSSLSDDAYNTFQFVNDHQFWAGGDHGFIELTTNAGEPTIPKALFSVDLSELNSSSKINLLNKTKQGYSYQWYKNSSLFSTQYNSSYLSNHLSIDTITLIVTKGSKRDTAKTVVDTRLNSQPCVAAFQTSIDTGSVKFIATDSSYGVKHYWNFGDGITDSVNYKPFHVYSQVGNYQVTHAVYNVIDGCKDSTAQTITIIRTRNCLVADFTYKVDSFYTNMVYLKPSYDTSGEIGDWPIVWSGVNWGDGTSISNSNYLHVYDSAKYYNVCLAVKNRFTECLSTVCKPVAIQMKETCDADFQSRTTDLLGHLTSLWFSGKPTARKSGKRNTWIVNNWQTFNTGNNTDLHTSFFEEWAEGEGEHFNTAGFTCDEFKVYAICLDSLTRKMKHIVTDSITGCSDMKEHTFTVPRARNVFIRAVPSPGMSQYVSFYAYELTSGGDTSYYSGRWRISGPGASAYIGGYDGASYKLTYHFPSPGDYKIAIGNNQCLNYEREVYYINYHVTADSCPVLPPDFRFEADSIRDLTIKFTDLSYNNYAIYHNNIKWYFGDGDSSVDFMPAHTYPKTGSYNVKMIYTNSNRCFKEVTKVVVVNSEKCRVNVAFSMSGSSVAPATITFLNLTQPDSANSYKWYFGTTDSSSLKNPVYTYKNEGTYTIRLVATANAGCQKYHDTTITIQKQPSCNIRADFTANGDTVAPATISFINTSQGASSYLWKFGDGSGSSTLNPIHIYTNPGTYSIQLTISSISGCTDTLNRTITILKKQDSCTLRAKYNYYKDSISSNTFYFINASAPLNPGTKITWNFGDGQSDNNINPVHHFEKIGSYKVCLLITQDSNCKAESCEAIKVEKPEKVTPILLSPNPVNTILSCSFDLLFADDVDLLIYNDTGHLVKTVKKHCISGINSIEISVHDLQRGLYMLRINTEKNILPTAKFIKM